MSGDLQVVGLGMCTLDVLLRLKDMPTWEHGTRIDNFRLDGGGPVGTAIVTAARLGARLHGGADGSLSRSTTVGAAVAHLSLRQQKFTSFKQFHLSETRASVTP